MLNILLDISNFFWGEFLHINPAWSWSILHYLLKIHFHIWPRSSMSEKPESSSGMIAFIHL